MGVEYKLEAPVEEGFLRDRQKGIGGSDVAALFGKSKFTTIYKLWEEKVGDPGEHEDTEYTVMGRLMEPYIRDLYEKATGLAVLTSSTCLTDGVLRGHVDGIATAKRELDFEAALKDEDSILVEIKNISEFSMRGNDWGGEGTDWIPDDYMLQVQTYLGITGLRKAHLVALFGGNKLRIFNIDFDPVLYAAIKERAEEFWSEHVLAKVSPPISYDAVGSEAADSLFEAERGLEYAPDSKIMKLVDSYLLAKEKAAAAEEEMEAIAAEIKDQMRSAVVCYGPDWRINYNPSYEKSYISWREIAEELKPKDELVEKHTRKQIVKRQFSIRRV